MAKPRQKGEEQGNKEKQKKPAKQKRGFLANFFEPLDAVDEMEDEDGVYAEDGDDEPEIDLELLPKKKKKRKGLMDYAREDFYEDPVEETPKPKTKKKKKGLFHKAAEEADAEEDEAASAAAPKDGETNETEPAVSDSEKQELFDDEADETDAEPESEPETAKHDRSATIPIGTGSASRVRIRPTEDMLRTEKAANERRAREVERVKKEQLSKKRRKQERKRGVQRAVGNLAFAGLIAISVLAALYYVFLLSDIIVSGNETYPTEYIIQQSGLKIGRHMLAVDLDEAKALIEDDPYLQVDSISYIFPARVRIMVTERREAAGLIGLDYNVIIDESGYVLSMGAGTDLSKLLQVTGVNMTGFQLGQRLGEGDDFTTATLVNLIAKLKEYKLTANIRSLDLTTPLATTMVASNGLKIFLGQPTDLDEKFSSLQKELPSFLRQNIYWGMLYLESKGGTVYSPREISEVLAEAATVEPTGEGTSGIDQIGSLGGDIVGAVEPGAAVPGQTPGGTNLPFGGEDEFSG